MKIVDTTRRRFAIVLATVIAVSCSKAAPTTPSPPASPQPPPVAPSPTVVVTGPTGSVFAGSPASLAFTVTDRTAFTLNVDFGDGSADSRSQPAAGVLSLLLLHAYRSSGEYVVSGTVTDDAGSRVMVSTKVVVLAR